MRQSTFILIGLLAHVCTASKSLPPTDDRYFRGAVPCGKGSDQRIGALCNDSTYSKAVGSGACSYHGGVKVWLCKY